VQFIFIMICYKCIFDHHIHEKDKKDNWCIAKDLQATILVYPDDPTNSHDFQWQLKVIMKGEIGMR